MFRDVTNVRILFAICGTCMMVPMELDMARICSNTCYSMVKCDFVYIYATYHFHPHFLEPIGWWLCRPSGQLLHGTGKPAKLNTNILQCHGELIWSDVSSHGDWQITPALAILIYFSHSHLLMIVPLALSIYGMVDSEIRVWHNCRTMPLFWHVTAFLTGKLIGNPQCVVLWHVGI